MFTCGYWFVMYSMVLHSCTFEGLVRVKVLKTGFRHMVTVYICSILFMGLCAVYTVPALHTVPATCTVGFIVHELNVDQSGLINTTPLLDNLLKLCFVLR